MRLIAADLRAGAGDHPVARDGDRGRIRAQLCAGGRWLGAYHLDVAGRTDGPVGRRDIVLWNRHRLFSATGIQRATGVSYVARTDDEGVEFIRR